MTNAAALRRLELSSFAVCDPKRLRASSRDRGGVVNQPRHPSQCSLRVIQSAASSSCCSAARRHGRWRHERSTRGRPTVSAADFLGDPTGTGLDMPSQTHRASAGLTAGSCGPFLFGRCLHGSTKLAGEGRLWMMRCAPSISIVAQSVSTAVILPPEMRHSRPAPFR